MILNWYSSIHISTKRVKSAIYPIVIYGSWLSVTFGSSIKRCKLESQASQSGYLGSQFLLKLGEQIIAEWLDVKFSGHSDDRLKDRAPQGVTKPVTKQRILTALACFPTDTINYNHDACTMYNTNNLLCTRACVKVHLNMSIYTDAIDNLINDNHR
jgi:hypothetical protein